MQRSQLGWFVVAFVFLSALGCVLCNNYREHRQLLPPDSLDSDAEIEERVVDERFHQSLPFDKRLLNDVEPNDYVQNRYKKYKLSFYDCISLYCGERIGIDRGQCILKFCHRT